MTLFVPGDMVMVVDRPEHNVGWSPDCYPGMIGLVTTMPYCPNVDQPNRVWSYCVDVRFVSHTRAIAVVLLRKIHPPEQDQAGTDEDYYYNPFKETIDA